MSNVWNVLSEYLGRGAIPGAVALVSTRDAHQVTCVGRLGFEPDDPVMEPDTIFRIASITKPITATAALMLIDDGRIKLDEPVTTWLPELAYAAVVRTPQSPIDDLVPVSRPLNPRDLLTSRAGWGFPSDFDLPAVQALFEVQPDGRAPHKYPAADDWLTSLAAVPMVAQPGQAWLYDTSYYLLGILIERVTGRRLDDVFTERIFEPLNMIDTGFVLPEAKLARFARYYLPTDDGMLEADQRQTWTIPPALQAGNGGLVGTAIDWLRFAKFLINRGTVGERRLLSEQAVNALLTNQLPSDQLQAADRFLEGQGWGYGGSVDLVRHQSWHSPGRYGWVGGTGTAAHVHPETGATTILLSNVGVTQAGPLPIYRDFWEAADNAAPIESGLTDG